MEAILQEINKTITLSDAEIKRNNVVLKSVISTFTEKMKGVDPLFKTMFTRVFYGGSFYDGLKICQPEEFDLDLLLKLPKLACPTVTTSNIPGFVHARLTNYENWMKQPEAKSLSYKNFGKLLDEKHYLDTKNVLSWMEGVVDKACNILPHRGNIPILTTEEGIFEVTVHKGGPALTLHIRGGNIQMDVDLVTCFVFGADKWPKNGFRSNPVASKPEFFIVPKKPKAPANQPILRYWRLSFQEQERVLIDHKERLKPSVRLLKNLRDNLQHNSIASYYIKTVVLHMVDAKDPNFWNGSLSNVFMTVLKQYKACIDNRKIPYYWNKNNNLLGGIDGITLDNISNRLRNVIRQMETNPTTLADYFGCKTDAGPKTADNTQPSSGCLLS